ncbi:MAG: hypothetical protein QOC80_2320 [Frankiaceae bacterium]|nr:hypothetical protein [Frankiaceae bacterium]
MSGAAVSVCVPVWNREDVLEQTLTSILEQTFDDLEVLVLDNASTDGSRTVAERVARRDSRVRVFVNMENIGGWPNHRRLLELASGRYVKFCNSDDLLSPGTIERLAGWLEDPSIGLAFARQTFADGNLRPLPGWGPPPLVAASGRIDGDTLIEACFERRSNLIGCPTATMFRRAELPPATWASLGGSTFWVAGDLASWFPLARARAVGYVHDAPAVVRVHTQMESLAPAVSVLDVTDWAGMALEARRLGWPVGEATLRTVLGTTLRMLAASDHVLGGSEWTPFVLRALEQTASTLGALDAGAALPRDFVASFAVPIPLPDMDPSHVACREIATKRLMPRLLVG